MMSMSRTAATPPKGLRKDGLALWTALLDVFDMSEDPHRLSLAEELCRCKDICVRLQEVVDKADSLRARGSQGQPVSLPELQELRQYRSLMASLTKSLGLPDTAELAEVKRQHLSVVRSAAARSRKVAY